MVIPLNVAQTSSPMNSEPTPRIGETSSLYSKSDILPSDNTDKVEEDVIVYFDTRSQFEDYVSTYKFVKKYPNLLAVRVDAFNDYILENKMEWYPTSHYQSIKLHTSRLNTIESNLTGLTSLHSKGYNGTGVVIGILDNGVDFTHPNLQSKSAGSYFAGIESAPSCGTHGTPVAGLLAGSPSQDFTGMAPGSKIFDISFSCVSGTIAGDFLAAFDKVISMNDTISVINTSFGGYSPSWDPVIRAISRSGIITVGSAGNSGPSFHSTTTGGPGNSIHGISVGAISSDGDLTSFSSTGPAHELTYKPDILAPGLNVLTTSVNGGLARYSGTSFSSPIVAGGIATLLEALNHNNVSYNPGLIKASLLETAQSIGQPELRQGQGIIQFDEALDLILSHNVSVPKVLSLQPTGGSIKYLQQFPHNAMIQLPISLISSHPTETTLQFNGDFEKVEYSIVDDYSQQIILKLNTSQFEKNTEISGLVSASVGGYNKSIELNFFIGGEPRGKIAVDLYHTYWDQVGANHIGGSNIGSMISLAMQQGYEITEINSKINSRTLEDVDILWMPDPLNLLSEPNNTLSENSFQEEQLKLSEIETIHKFVALGGSLFISTLGTYYVNGNTDTIYGLNTTSFNLLMKPYDISAYRQPLNLASSEPLPVNNISTLVRDVSYITHAGNYLKVGPKSSSLVGPSTRSSLAYYKDPTNLGEVLISSTNYWLDNKALTGGYHTKSDDSTLSSRVWDWMNESSSLIKSSDSISGNQLQGTFYVKGEYTPEDVELYLKNKDGTRDYILQSITSDEVSFNLQVDGEGIYDVIASIDNEYIGWHYTKDHTGPSIMPTENNLNGSNFKDQQYVILTFNINDELSEINYNSLRMFLNDNTIDVLHSFNDDLETLKIIIPMVAIENNKKHVLKLEITDVLGNIGSVTYEFSVGDISTADSFSKNSTTSRTFWRFNIMILLIIYTARLRSVILTKITKFLKTKVI